MATDRGRSGPARQGRHAAHSVVAVDVSSAPAAGARRTRMSRLHDLVPAGCHTYSKGADRFPPNAPKTLVRGYGGLVWAADGREFIDWGMGINNVLIGHAEASIDGAAIAALRGGQAFCRPSDLEEAAADAVLSLFPQADMIKFCKNGSDANNAAIRLARAVTGRQHIAFDATAPF